MARKIPGTSITANTLPASAIVANSITSTQLTTTVVSQIQSGAGGGPKITQIQITDSAGTVLDDTAVSTDGGYIKITGSGFSSGATVIVGSTPATSTTFVSSTVLRAQVPAGVAGTYIVYVVNTDGGTAIAVNGLTFSGTPAWVTASSLSTQYSNVAISIQLSATGDSPLTYSLAAGNTLPSGLTLSSSGLLSGTVVVGANTVYNFTVNAIDPQSQDSPRAFSLTVSAQSFPPTLEYLVVAGGGGGGNNGAGGGGGGGAGGYRTAADFAITPGTTYTVTVGGGGAGATATSYTSGTAGSNSVFSSITSIGGGRGAGAPSGGFTGGSGGSGGGGSAGGNGGENGSGGAGTPGQGNNGGTGISQSGAGYGGGGGGGAGAVGGGSMNLNAGKGGDGGAGLSSSISGSAVTYAGGGGGGGNNIFGGSPGGAGGSGGGGVGSTGSNGSGGSGTVNTGGGAGGAHGSGTAGTGGSGIVILRYSDSFAAASNTTGSPTITVAGGYRVYKFTSSGSITF